MPDYSGVGLGLLQGYQQERRFNQQQNATEAERARRDQYAERSLGLREAQNQREQQAFDDKRALTADALHEKLTGEQRQQGYTSALSFLRTGAETGDWKSAAQLANQFGAIKIDPNSIQVQGDKAHGYKVGLTTTGPLGTHTIPLTPVKTLISVFQQRLGMQPTAQKPVAVGKGDVLVDPSTGKPIYSNRQNGGRDMSPYNPQRAYDQISDNIAEVLGGKFDSITGKYTVPAGQSQRFSAATALAQTVEHGAPGEYPPGVVARAALAGTQNLLTPDQALAQAKKEADDNDGGALSLVTTQPWEKQGITEEQWIQRRAQQLHQQSVQKMRQAFKQALTGGRTAAQSRPGLAAAGAQRTAAKPPAGLADVQTSGGQKAAPKAALDYLRAHPQTAAQFQQTFGYLPSWAKQVSNAG